MQKAAGAKWAVCVAGVGGCHRQIKSLLLMRCADMVETGAAPPNRLQLNLEGEKQKQTKNLLIF